MNDETQQTPGKKGSAWKVAGLMLLTVALSAMVAVGAVYFILFPSDFKPVELSQKEEQVLEQKLARFDSLQQPAVASQQQPLTPERYSEEGASREINLMPVIPCRACVSFCNACRPIVSRR